MSEDAGVFAEGDIVRLVNLNFMQIAHDGALVAVRLRVHHKNAYEVILPDGGHMEVEAKSMKRLDAEDLFHTGDFVRLVRMPLLHKANENHLATVQHYLPHKDMWVVQVQTQTKGSGIVEVYSSTLKPVDDADLFFTGELLRVKSGEAAGEVVTVRDYQPLKDAWRATRISGKDVDVHSENAVVIKPDAHKEGDLVVYKGTVVLVQCYLPAADRYRILKKDGTPVDVYLEDLAEYDPANPPADTSSSSPSAAGGGSGGGFLKSLQAAGGAGGGFLKKMWGGGSGGGSNSGGLDSGPPRYRIGDQVHLHKAGWKEEGTVALVKDVVSRKKYKVVLNTGETMSVSDQQMKPPIPQGRFAEGQKVTFTEGGAGVIRAIDELRGMLVVRADLGMKDRHVFVDGVVGGDVDAGANDALFAPPAAAPSAPTGDEAVLAELQAALAQAGASLEEVRQFNDADLDELLKDELKIPVLKRNKMKHLIRGGGGGGSGGASGTVPVPAPVPVTVPVPAAVAVPQATPAPQPTAAAPAAPAAPAAAAAAGHADPFAFLN